ncbi:MAG: hypothetical protein HRT90_03635 [Candidatus Margulisbacteria bacterium]|nr:hypothetical protein [Candidatus Margulisiibacteriota bacterium]
MTCQYKIISLDVYDVAELKRQDNCIEERQKATYFDYICAFDFIYPDLSRQKLHHFYNRFISRLSNTVTALTPITLDLFERKPYSIMNSGLNLISKAVESVLQGTDVGGPISSVFSVLIRARLAYIERKEAIRIQKIIDKIGNGKMKEKLYKELSTDLCRIYQWQIQQLESHEEAEYFANFCICKIIDWVFTASDNVERRPLRVHLIKVLQEEEIGIQAQLRKIPGLFKDRLEKGSTLYEILDFFGIKTIFLKTVNGEKWYCGHILTHTSIRNINPDGTEKWYLRGSSKYGFRLDIHNVPNEPIDKNLMHISKNQLGKRHFLPLIPTFENYLQHIYKPTRSRESQGYEQETDFQDFVVSETPIETLNVSNSFCKSFYTEEWFEKAKDVDFVAARINQRQIELLIQSFIKEPQIEISPSQNKMIKIALMSFWGHLDLTRINNINEQYLRYIVDSTPFLDYLLLSYDRGGIFEHSNLTDKDLAQIAKNHYSIKTLILRECQKITDKGLTELSKAYTGLHEVQLHSCSNSIRDDGIISLIKANPDLTRITINNSLQSKIYKTDAILNALCDHCPQLISLKIHSTVITDKGLIRFIEKFPMLQEISLGVLPEISIKSITSLCELSHIEDLYFDTVNSLRSRHIVMLLRNNPNLRSLRVSGCDELTIYELRDLIRNQRKFNIRDLYFKECLKINREKRLSDKNGLHEICPNLDRDNPIFS